MSNPTDRPGPYEKVLQTVAEQRKAEALKANPGLELIMQLMGRTKGAAAAGEVKP